MIIRRMILILVLGIVVSSVCAQTFSVKGKVLNEAGEPLPLATVYVHETLSGDVTDESGNFEIKGLKRGRYHLHVHYLGYESGDEDVEITTADVVLNFKLKSSAIEAQGYVMEESILRTRNEESTLKIEVVNREYLQRHSGQSLVNQLDQLPGINAMNMGTGIAKPVIRGFSFNRVVVIDKGIKQEGQQWGWDHGLEIDQFDVERVEIIKGPASLMFGSDAVGGVLHLGMPEIPAKNSFEFNSITSYRSVNQNILQSAQFKTRIGSWALGGRFSYQNFGDYRVPADTFLYNTYLLPIVNNRLKNTAGTEQNFSIFSGIFQNWGYSLVTVSRVQQQSGFFAGAIGTPKSYNLQDDFDSRNVDYPFQGVTHWKVTSNSAIRIAKNWLNIDVGYQRNERTENSYPHNNSNDYIFDTTNIEHAFTLQTASLNARYHFGKPDKNDWVIGASYQFQDNQFSGFSFLLPQFQTHQAGAFGYFRRKLNSRLRFNMGLRVDVAHYNVKAHMQPRYNFQGDLIAVDRKNGAINTVYVNGSGSVGLAYLVNEQLTLKWNFGSSYRLPTVPELASNGVHHGTFRHEMGDSSLTPERGVQLDFILEWKRKKWEFTLTPFGYFFHNFIYLQPTGQFSPLPEAGQLYRYAQANVFQGGLEVAFDYHIIEPLHLGASAEWVYAYNFNDGYPIPFIPPAALQVELEYTFNWIKPIKESYIRMDAKLAAPQNFVARNEKQTPGYGLLNLALGIPVQFKTVSLTFLAEVQNLLDTRYMVHMNRYRILNLPEPGRNFSLSLVLKWKANYPNFKKK